MLTCSKLFREFASAYRNCNSTTDCFLLHGYCRDFKVEFGASELDKSGFVVDYGSPVLKEFKRWLDEKFDHTTVLQADDPHLGAFKELEKGGQLKLTLLPMVSAEGWAMYIAKKLQDMLDEAFGGRVWVNYVECRENGKNSSTYINKIYTNNEGHVADTDDITFVDLLELVQDMDDNYGR